MHSSWRGLGFIRVGVLLFSSESAWRDAYSIRWGTGECGARGGLGGQQVAGRCLAGLRAGEDCSTETLHLNKIKSMGRLLDVVCSSQQRGPTTPRLDGLILRAAAAAKRQPDAAATTGGGGPCGGLKRAAADAYRRLRHLGRLPLGSRRPVDAARARVDPASRPGREARRSSEGRKGTRPLLRTSACPDCAQLPHRKGTRARTQLAGGDVVGSAVISGTQTAARPPQRTGSRRMKGITSSVCLSWQEVLPAAVQHATCASGQGCC